MADGQHRLAIDTVARRILRHTAYAHFTGTDLPNKVDYPELSANDWFEVLSRIIEVADMASPSEAEFQAAYEYLTGDDDV